MTKKMVVIRQNVSSIPVISYIFDFKDIPEDRDVPDMYAREKCMEHIENFARRFPDFKETVFHFQTIEVVNGECQHLHADEIKRQ